MSKFVDTEAFESKKKGGYIEEDEELSDGELEIAETQEMEEEEEEEEEGEEEEISPFLVDRRCGCGEILKEFFPTDNRDYTFYACVNKKKDPVTGVWGGGCHAWFKEETLLKNPDCLCGFAAATSKYPSALFYCTAIPRRCNLDKDKVEYEGKKAVKILTKKKVKKVVKPVKPVKDLGAVAKKGQQKKKKN